MSTRRLTPIALIISFSTSAQVDEVLNIDFQDGLLGVTWSFAGQLPTIAPSTSGLGLHMVPEEMQGFVTAPPYVPMTFIPMAGTHRTMRTRRRLPAIPTC